MSRRDTIFVAILINTGLLLILFITAITGDGNKVAKEEQLQQAEALVNAQELPSHQPTALLEVEEKRKTAITSKEIDRVVSQKERFQREEKQVVETIPERKLTQEEQAAIANLEPILLASDEKPLERKSVEVVVKRGDYLDKIARANGTTVQEIMRVNNLRNTKLQIGQVLKIPLLSAEDLAKEKMKNSPEGKPEVEDSDFYVMKKGDNPWLIAMKHRMKLDELLRLNNLDEMKARRLKPGDKIRIR